MDPPSVTDFCHTALTDADYESLQLHLALWGHITVAGEVFLTGDLNRGLILVRARLCLELMDELWMLPRKLRIQPGYLGGFNLCMLQPLSIDLFADLPDPSPAASNQQRAPSPASSVQPEICGDPGPVSPRAGEPVSPRARSYDLVPSAPLTINLLDGTMSYQ